jgi:hypothetical protein
MSINDADLVERLHAVAEGFEMPAAPLVHDVSRGRRRARRNRALVAGAVAATVAAAIGVTAVVSGQDRAGPAPVNPPNTPTPTTSTQGPIPTATPVRGELVLHLHSWSGGPGSGLDRTPVELAVYADGWVIWHYQDDQLGYHQMRLTPNGVTWLEGRATSTGLFERDHALGIEGSSGDLQVRVGDRTAIVAWGRSKAEVSSSVNDVLEGTGLSLQAPFVAATKAQSDALIHLEGLLREPGAWAPAPGRFERREDLPFIPTHLWVSWDRSVPDPSKLPSPAREVLTRDLGPVLDGSCGVISLAQAQEMVQAMEQVGLAGPDDVTDGISFDMPGEGAGVSFLHAHPSLPGETGTCA